MRPEIVGAAALFAGTCVSLAFGALKLLYYVEKQGLPYEMYTRPVFNFAVLFIVAMATLATVISLGTVFWWFGSWVYTSVAAVFQPAPTMALGHADDDYCHP